MADKSSSKGRKHIFSKFGRSKIIQNFFCVLTESSNGNGLETNGMFSVKDDRELIFPPELRVRAAELCAESVTFIGEKVTWFRPSTLDELLHLKNSHPDAKFIGGNTEIGVETKLKNMHYPKFIQTSQVRFQDISIICIWYGSRSCSSAASQIVVLPPIFYCLKYIWNEQCYIGGSRAQWL